jgi:hypothetical protein
MRSLFELDISRAVSNYWLAKFGMASVTERSKAKCSTTVSLKIFMFKK